ncbi:MAG: class I SAM-dependent methyltransferase [Microcoleaceae cyanobacterium]
MVVNKPIAMSQSDELETALLKKVKRLSAAHGQLSLPCVPALLDEYMAQFDTILVALGQKFKPEEMQKLRQLVQRKLEEGYQKTPHARLIFKYEPPDPTQGLTSGLKLSVTVEGVSLEDKYQRWLTTREGPLFGSHPDAKFMAVIGQLGSNKAGSPILDIGAGVGRNTLPVAQQGHPVDAVELTPEFVQIIAQQVKQQSLKVRVIQSNIFNPALKLPQNYYKLALVSEVITHFRSLAEVRTLLAMMCNAIQPGGLLLFNLFVADEGYQPDQKVREMSQVQWSYLITRNELNATLQGLPLNVISDESVYDYERTHLPTGSWPPTSWFEHWCLGRDIFPLQKPPISLRWILCQVN